MLRAITTWQWTKGIAIKEERGPEQAVSVTNYHTGEGEWILFPLRPNIGAAGISVV